MSDQYQDRTQYIVYFVVGAIMGALVGLKFYYEVVPWWRPVLGFGLGFGFLAVFLGDKFWGFAKRWF